MFFIDVPEIVFNNRQNIPWEDVETLLKGLIGREIVVKHYGDIIHIAGDFPDEYTESKYTKKLRGALAKAKANAGQIIEKLIEHAVNRRWVENKDPKHKKEANGGWYRYDVGFTIPVNENGKCRKNSYTGTIVVRIKNEKLYLYDLINIKKETSTPL